MNLVGLGYLEFEWRNLSLVSCIVEIMAGRGFAGMEEEQGKLQSGFGDEFVVWCRLGRDHGGG